MWNSSVEAGVIKSTHLFREYLPYLYALWQKYSLLLLFIAQQQIDAKN